MMDKLKSIAVSLKMKTDRYQQ